MSCGCGYARALTARVRSQSGNPSRAAIEEAWRTLRGVHRTQLEERDRERAMGLWDEPEVVEGEEKPLPFHHTVPMGDDDEDKGIDKQRVREISGLTEYLG